jgi:hypothetical protein
MFRRRFSRFTLRFGDGDLPFLKKGFSVPPGQGDDLHRSTRDGFIEVELHRAEDYVVGFQVAGNEGQTLSVAINNVAALSCPLTPLPAHCEGIAEAHFLREGENEIRIKIEPITPATADARVFSLDLTPKRNTPDTRPSPSPTTVEVRD